MEKKIKEVLRFLSSRHDTEDKYEYIRLIDEVKVIRNRLKIKHMTATEADAQLNNIIKKGSK